MKWTCAGISTSKSGEADLLVNFGANASEKIDVRSTPTSMGVGYGGYYGYRGGMYGASWSTSDVETVRYKVGTANIDVVDARQEAAGLGRPDRGQVDRQGHGGSARYRERDSHRNLQTVSG